jgi:hypothetical protein
MLSVCVWKKKEKNGREGSLITIATQENTERESEEVRERAFVAGSKKVFQHNNNHNTGGGGTFMYARAHAHAHTHTHTHYTQIHTYYTQIHTRTIPHTVHSTRAQTQ